MKRWPARHDIFAAECRLTRSIFVSRASFARARSNVRSRLTQPSSFFVAMGLGILSGVWVVRRNRPRVRDGDVPARTPIVGMVYALLVRFGMRRLARAWARRRQTESTTR